ncbi:MAG: 4Fe-4S dicluster domain-containing protein [Planctomycetota bacterium]|jgi:formate hydrogenlyase subunit 6/NADH:ubiquinone oxidoreductase subunit I
MTQNAIPDFSAQARVIEPVAVDALIKALRSRGYEVCGPTIRDGAIVYDEVSGIDDLPRGWTERQGPGTYRLERRDDDALFGYVVGPHSWKRYLHAPWLTLFKAEAGGTGLKFRSGNEGPTPRYAFLGMRACELAAITVQDRVLLGDAYVDPHYQARRDGAFFVAVQCAVAGGTCFCTSMKTGPQVSGGYDLALTEVIEGDRHHLLVEVGSERGAEVLADLPHRTAEPAERDEASAVVERTAQSMGRQLDTEGVKELLYQNLEHTRWDDVASRCLACANCTMVCPTCFCTSVEDVPDLTGASAERVRMWDSCFTTDHSYLHGGSVHSGIKSRYRQWLTHKLASWIDQFGTSGCVGCGRCITWCPVGIDLTEEVAAIRSSSSSKEHQDSGQGEEAP